MVRPAMPQGHKFSASCPPQWPRHSHLNNKLGNSNGIITRHKFIIIYSHVYYGYIDLRVFYFIGTAIIISRRLFFINS